MLSAPEGMAIDELGRVVWLPTAEQFGVHSVEIEVTNIIKKAYLRLSAALVIE